MTRTIGEAIEGRLHEMRIQQKELAAVIDVPVSTLNSWLRLGRDIPAHYILKIAHVLRCTPDLSAVGRRGRPRDPNQKRRHRRPDPRDRGRGAAAAGSAEAARRHRAANAYRHVHRTAARAAGADQSGAGRRTRRPDPRDVLPHGRGAAGRRDHGHTGSDPCVHASTYTSSDLSSPRRSATRSSTQPASRYLFAA
nr:putative protein [uncultured bacterium]